MPGPTARLLPDGARLHLNHGPIDLIIGCYPERPDGRDRAFRAAVARFQTILEDLVAELPLLRREVGDWPKGAVARRMVAAAMPHAPTFVTPMAAVAGAVAEEVLAAMLEATALRRAYVNNGGDIAFHLAEGTRFRMAIAGPDGVALGQVDVHHHAAARGLATSGQGGRSLSFGIADAVTVLAQSAAAADVAATLVANAVDLPGHPTIERVAATAVQANSDLGDRKVVRSVGALTADETRFALERGCRAAKAMLDKGLLISAALFMNQQACCVGASDLVRLPTERTPAHA